MGQRPPPPRPEHAPNATPWIAVGGVLGVAAAVGITIAVSPALGVLVALVAVGFGVLLSRPEYAAAAVAFLLWANIPVVAMREHGVPQFMAAAYLLLLGLPIVFRAGSSRRLAWSPAVPWVALYVGFGVLSAMLSRDPERSLTGVQELFLEGLVVFVLTSLAIRDRESLRRVTWGLMAAGTLMGAIALFHQLSGRFDSNLGGMSLIDSGFSTGEISTQGRASQPRLAGPVGEKNRFGQIMLVLLALGVGLGRAEASRGLRRLAYVTAALSAIGAALTFSRGNAVALVLLMPVMLATGAVTRRQCGGVALAGFVLLMALPQYRERLATIPSVLLLASSAPAAESPDGAIMGRATEVIAAVLVYIDHPVLGVGPGMFVTYSQEYGNTLGLRRLDSEREAHTMFPHIAAEGGTLGLLSFSGALVVVLLGLLRGARRARDAEARGLCSAYLLALMAYLACGLFLHMSFIRYFWFLLGVAAAAARIGDESLKVLRAPDSPESTRGHSGALPAPGETP